jgi:FixJ family two-component response regulator
MPDMECFELKSHFVAVHIPIILVTASADEETRARALHVGAVDFQQKPAGEEVFIKKLLLALKVRRRQAPDKRVGGR